MTLLKESEKQALDILKASLEEQIGTGLFEMRLFGSKARGDSTPESDIDVIIIVEAEDWPVCDTIYRIVTDIELEKGVYISPTVISRNDYKRNLDIDAPFIRNIVIEGISV